MTLTRQHILFAALIVGALVMEVAILVWFFDERAEDDPVIRDGVESRFDNTAECGDAALFGTSSNVRLDDAKRFAVKVPPTWASRAEDNVITLSKKNGRATLSVGRARPGDLLVALTDLRASLRRSYRDLDFTSEELLVLDGCPARSIAGSAATAGARAWTSRGSLSPDQLTTSSSPDSSSAAPSLAWIKNSNELFGRCAFISQKAGNPRARS